ncbi:hypothetical protein Pure05_40360 [Paenarthrobacter ureafaciens]|nr:hypothetical protein Pure01_40530 [Paenarthrobacter ureafaciens]GLU65814.1 hypothetical protein Pure02_40640 [Paenarthrobacter ureafaciens]GLU70109.1 hypothetical protein Pure03_40850 [Paenarthrobacter ureafaciens]GLU74373.1 hypothetical protein Pure04_40880 [Paenarthrobacter ureafaciens]GLU78596.1 hypothetical protein Pure05_40360 [Paenarthrobacter ureafaciens]
MATGGQFYWPSVGIFVAAYGQFFMAANSISKAGSYTRREGRTPAPTETKTHDECAVTTPLQSAAT